MNNESAYWIALAHLPGWGHLNINNLIIKFYHENKLSIEDFFQLTESDWKIQYGLDYKEVEDLKKAKSELTNNAFLAETLHNEGYELIPITSTEYSKTLKDNLKTAHAPALLYVKGNKQIMLEKSIAIVGSRNASYKSLEFTDNIAKLASKEYKVVVSGFAKGVDKQALDSAIRYKGQSIIVLPQGITTFNSGFKTYYKQIVDGDVLVLSTFHPKAFWSAGFAMARNPIIYGLADEIYVSESSEKGGTWSGVIDGLRKGRKIFVRNPEAYEKNANSLLIQKGATAVDFNGVENTNTLYFEQTTVTALVQEPSVSIDNVNDRILKVFKGKPLSAQEILNKVGLDWTTKKLTSHLLKMEEIQTVKMGRTTRYILKANQVYEPTLFG